MTYLNDEQRAQLLRPLNPSRVAVLDGMSHLEAWDVRAHLNRVFGFARWSADLVELEMLYETATQTKAGKPAFAVAYRATLRLTVNAPDGTSLSTYTEAATGDALMPDFKRGDAHDFAIKGAESQALKRCAMNLGDQFGLSLYDSGSTRAVVGRTLDGPAVDQPSAPVIEPVPSPQEPTQPHDEPTEPVPAADSLSPEAAAVEKQSRVDDLRERLTAAPDAKTVSVLIGDMTKWKLRSVTVADSNGEPLTLGALAQARLAEVSK